MLSDKVRHEVCETKDNIYHEFKSDDKTIWTLYVASRKPDFDNVNRFSANDH